MPLEEDRIPLIEAALQAELEKVVIKTGLIIEAEAKARARVRTGYMRQAIRWTPSQDPLEGEVTGGAEYTVYNEYGTVYMAPQPMFWPAVEIARPIFEREIRAAIERAVNI